LDRCLLRTWGMTERERRITGYRRLSFGETDSKRLGGEGRNLERPG
jgi:hypothetical protein